MKKILVQIGVIEVIVVATKGERWSDWLQSTIKWYQFELTHTRHHNERLSMDAYVAYSREPIHVLSGVEKSRQDVQPQQYCNINATLAVFHLCEKRAATREEKSERGREREKRKKYVCNFSLYFHSPLFVSCVRFQSCSDLFLLLSFFIILSIQSIGFCVKTQ